MEYIAGPNLFLPVQVRSFTFSKSFGKLHPTKKHSCYRLAKTFCFTTGASIVNALAARKKMMAMVKQLSKYLRNVVGRSM